MCDLEKRMALLEAKFEVIHETVIELIDKERTERAELRKMLDEAEDTIAEAVSELANYAKLLQQ